jgi:hypothetical protein
MDDETTRAQAARIEELEARLRQLEGRRRMRGLLRNVVPSEAADHFRAAGREHLLGMRSLVDHWIRRMDDADAASGGTSSGGEIKAGRKGRAGRGGREDIPIE